MLEYINGALGAVKGIADIASGISSLNTEAAKNDAVIGIQRHLLETQKGLMEAENRHLSDTMRIKELEQEILRLSDWSKEKLRYELVAVRGGAFAYMFKQGMNDDAPPHWLCTNCFEQGRKSILQHKATTSAGHANEAFGCDICKGGFQITGRTRPFYKWETGTSLPGS